MEPKLLVSQIDSYIDEDIKITVSGCEKNDEVSIFATTFDDGNNKFRSEGKFLADCDGMVKVDSQRPIAGTYGEVDGSGLFWSMERADSPLGDYYEKKSSEPVKIQLVLQVNGKVQDSVTINRNFYKKDVKKESIEQEEIKGTLFHPIKKGRYPSVIILSGSDGGKQEHAAALLASKGYTVFALSYFGEEGVPDNLEYIPLEYFRRATMWLKEHPFVNGQISLIGFSRGGELALLLGATYDCYQSIIASAPSAYITSGMKNGVFAPVSSWLLNQQALPYLKFTYRFSTLFNMAKNWIMKRPVSYLSIWDNSLKGNEAIKEAQITVKDIHVPIMLISGEDDQLWPSARYVKMMEEKLRNSKGSQRNRYLYYQHAGHFLSFPYSFANLPANIFMNAGGMTMTFGGSKQANARAAKDSWEKILHFLDETMEKS